MVHRPVPLRVLLQLVRLQGPGGVLGLVFMLVPPVVVPLPVLLVEHHFTQPYERYDAAAIQLHGRPAVARLLALTPVPGITVNGAHPCVVRYTYPGPSGPVTDQFQTLELAKLRGLHAGDALPIQTLNGQSIIPALQPFRVPYEYFYLLPIVFVFIGLPFFLRGFRPAWRRYRLYRHGLVRSATVRGITSRTYPLSRGRQQRVWLISYAYAGWTHPQLQGESPTDDGLVVQQTKVGDRVDIFVSETDDTRSCLVPRQPAWLANERG